MVSVALAQLEVGGVSREDQGMRKARVFGHVQRG
jgi:hypothetical protein